MRRPRDPSTFGPASRFWLCAMLLAGCGPDNGVSPTEESTEASGPTSGESAAEGGESESAEASSGEESSGESTGDDDCQSAGPSSTSFEMNFDAWPHEIPWEPYTLACTTTLAELQDTGSAFAFDCTNEMAGTGSIGVTFTHAHTTVPDITVGAEVSLAFDVSPWGGLQVGPPRDEWVHESALVLGGGGYPPHYVVIRDASGIVAGAVDFYSLPGGVFSPYELGLGDTCGQPPSPDLTYTGELLVSDPGTGESISIGEGETATLGEHLFELGNLNRNYPEGGSTPWWIEFVVART